MKKLLTVALILALLLPVAALADLPDISGLSFEELVQLREQLNLAIWNSEEWQEVTVPIGAWKIGEDIPVGKWTITAAGDHDIYVVHCDMLDASGMDWNINGRFHYYTTLLPQDSEKDDDPKSIDINGYKGNYIIIKGGSAVFRPYTGKPDLGFK